LDKITVSVVGASGYTGGELIRLLASHPFTELRQITSESNYGKFAFKVHPNLRRLNRLKFSSINEIEDCDTLFLCLPHGESQKKIDQFKGKAEKIIDLSADFRLKDPNLYKHWYGNDHTRADLLSDFCYGIPELHRQEMKKSDFVSSAGCNATVSILGLMPFFRENLVDRDRTVIEVKVGSSEGGNKHSEASHHPIRSGSVRSYKPTGHRHTAEILQELSFGENITVHLSATSIDMVRGVLATCHIFPKEKMDGKDVWKLYRKYYADEPFIRIVKEREGNYRYPEPKILAGTNFCDIGFEKDEIYNRITVISAIDNLMKGAAGQALQAFNIMYGIDERTGLDFHGLHPV
jgi:N-acetyl-gamma-glutamyl-phosphate/LysW-gamma-L-alpha-aminoadipyl-6-phosphate reductase